MSRCDAVQCAATSGTKRKELGMDLTKGKEFPQERIGAGPEKMRGFPRHTRVGILRGKQDSVDTRDAAAGILTPSCLLKGKWKLHGVE